MKKLKAILSAVFMLAVTLAATGCGSSGSSSSYNNPMDEGKKESLLDVAKSSGLLDGELENKSVTWISTWDINPDEKSGKKTPADLALFQEIYGGKIEFQACTDDNRFDVLAESVNGGKGADMFYAGNLDTFPRCTLKNNMLFAPSDDYIDYSSELWQDVQDVNDSYMWNDKHYISIIQETGDTVACVYSRKTIQEAGLEDPAKLYAEGKWDWAAFQDMLEKFVGSGDQHYGIDGWFFEFGLMNTIGVPPVGFEDGKLVSHISDPSMERVQEWIYELYQKNCIAIGVGDYGWEDKPHYIGEGKLLFYPVGLYEFYKEPKLWQERFGTDDVFFVPMPKDPKADQYYIPTGIESYAFISGGANPEGVAKYLNCKRFCAINDEARAIADSIFVDDYGWTQEMVDMREEMNRLARENPVIDVSKGVNKDCADLVDNKLRLTARGTPWNETFNSINAAVNKIIDEVNASL